ncbi:hypothetical protein Tco_1581937 [Tanacetum coccineum]
MVAYLQKPEGSEAFHQIMDFLNASYIKTTDDGEVEITASIDGQVKTITEASLRRHLKLEESDGDKDDEDVILEGDDSGVVIIIGNRGKSTLE